MRTNSKESPVWKSRDGEITISTMSDEHIQKAYKSAEYRYLKYKNLSVVSSEKSTMYEKKLLQLEEEAMNRKYTLSSMALKNESKFGLLKERRVVEAL